jgi:hypothetical protein
MKPSFLTVLIDAVACVGFFIAEVAVARDLQTGLAYGGIAVLFLARVLWGPR